jgi:Peptidase family M23
MSLDGEEGMSRSSRRIVSSMLGLAAAAVGYLAWFPDAARAAAVAAAEDQLTPLLARVLAPPAVVLQSDGVWKLPYELELVNVADVPLTVDSVEASDPGQGGKVVASMAGPAVAPNLALPGGVKSATLGPGQSGVLFVNATFARREDVPAKLVHRIVAKAAQPKPPLPERNVEVVAATDVTTSAPIVVGPPLRGDRWVAEASCCDSYHRRAVLPVNGARHLAQRYAIDWIQLTADGRLASGDPKRNESYPQFGQEALAVAPATVVHVQDDLPEGTPGSFPPGVTAMTADGNAVVLDLGGGRYALYAHLQPGSIRVRVGDRVERGQVLGLVGNTGNSDAPHLHFHVMDGPSPLASNGVPYVIDAFELTGRAVSESDLDDELKNADQPLKTEPAKGPPQRKDELPANLAIVKFP